MMEYPENVRKSIFQTILRKHMTAGVIDLILWLK